MTVADIETRMSGEEFAEWVALTRIENQERKAAENQARINRKTQALANRG